MEGGNMMDTILSEIIIEEIAEAWCKAKSPVVFTGAGVSTDSGIPDYRSPQGEWKKHPQVISTIEVFMNQPELFYSYYQNQIFRLVNTQPNPGHRILAELEARDLVKAVITQNIDNLHQAAGSRNVIELHGTLRTVSCISCRRRYPSQKILFEAVEQRPESGGSGNTRFQPVGVPQVSRKIKAGYCVIRRRVTSGGVRKGRFLQYDVGFLCGHRFLANGRPGQSHAGVGRRQGCPIIDHQ